MSTDHPGRPFRYGIRFKIAVSIGVIMIALMAVDILWNLSLQNAQAENEAREKAEVLAAEMRAAWDFVDMNQEVINRAEDGAFRTKHLVCVVAAKSISMLFTSETDYSIRFTNDTPRQAANAPGRLRAGGPGRLQRRPRPQGILARRGRRRRHAGVPLYGAVVRDRVVPRMSRRPRRRAGSVRLPQGGHAGGPSGRRHVHHRAHGHLRRRHSR